MSPYARSRVVDGEFVEKYTLREKWKARVLYVLACATDLRPFRMGLSPRMRKFLETLDPAFDAPCRSTCYRIAIALQWYNEEKREELFNRLSRERMPGFVATTEDSRSDGKGKAHYTSTMAGVIVGVHQEHGVDARSLTIDEIKRCDLLAAGSGNTLVLKNIQLVLSFDLSDSTDKADDVAER